MAVLLRANRLQPVGRKSRVSGNPRKRLSEAASNGQPWLPEPEADPEPSERSSKLPRAPRHVGPIHRTRPRHGRGRARVRQQPRTSRAVAGTDRGAPQRAYGSEPAPVSVLDLTFLRWQRAAASGCGHAVCAFRCRPRGISYRRWNGIVWVRGSHACMPFSVDSGRCPTVAWDRNRVCPQILVMALVERFSAEPFVGTGARQFQRFHMRPRINVLCPSL